ncbi:MAG: class I SAM-dependent methyltransferase [Verrucomicrobia bacterium]|nr:class I SAM-dependent methyltransferase [Verrucomicrobiota bacterium]MCH8511442.1 cyclopropane-fatty-acyl-phospholipid synthase family protein [Kiritimatiellia bacterium]
MDPSKTILNPAYLDTANMTLSERILVHALSKLQGARLKVMLPSGHHTVVGDGGADEAELHILESTAIRRMLLGGSMAFAETYMDGSWKTDDLSTLLRILSKNQQDMGRLMRGASKMLRAMDHAAHRMRSNTLDNARKNIQEHYDLSNDLYATFLDPTLTYSAAIFADPTEDLLTAQLRKIDRLIDQLNPGAGDHVLEIGSGWGACAIRLAQKRGCRVTSVTLSEAQAEEARRRVQAAGVADLVEIRLQDYREVPEIFDHVLSVEMIEAVGHEFLPVYLETVQQRLKPGGRFVLQSITIPEARYKSYTISSDFIRKHIFPGGHLPSPELLQGLVKRHTDWRCLDMCEFGRDYAETLRRWRDAFASNLSKVKELGFDDRFIRKWFYYLAYCEAGFDNQLIHVRQFTFQK